MTELTEKPCAHCHNLFTPITNKKEIYCKRPECILDRKRAYKAKWMKANQGNLPSYNKSRCPQRKPGRVDWVKGDQLIAEGSLKAKEIAVALGCEASTVHWRIRKLKREAETPIDRSFNYGPPGHCDRGTKRGFVRYFNKNDVHFRTLWKTGTPAEAWEGMIGRES